MTTERKTEKVSEEKIVLEKMGPGAWLVYRNDSPVAIGLLVHRDGLWQGKVSGDILARDQDMSICVEALCLHAIYATHPAKEG
jgi:hypothetical protein